MLMQQCVSLLSCAIICCGDHEQYRCPDTQVDPHFCIVWPLRVGMNAVVQTHVSGSDDDDTSRDGGGIQHLAVARQEPLMLAGCLNGLVQLYDLRQSQKAAASVQPHRTPMVRCIRFIVTHAERCHV